jgi:TRAP-type C4-dicarboxylate transport system permease small subunit
VKRLLFALFLALVACGISFYVVLFCSLGFYLFIKGLNPVEAPGLVAGLRHVALPVSAALGVLAFIFGIRRKDTRVLPAGR